MSERVSDRVLMDYLHATWAPMRSDMIEKGTIIVLTTDIVKGVYVVVVPFSIEAAFMQYKIEGGDDHSWGDRFGGVEAWIVSQGWVVPVEYEEWTYIGWPHFDGTIERV